MWLVLALLAMLAVPQGAQRRPAPPAPFKTPLTVAQMTNTQAVVETTAGTFIIVLRPELAPNHVGYFITQAREGAYAGTIFHRVVRDGIIQGGDPLSKDPSKSAQVGSGGLGVLQADYSAEPFARGAVGAALRPNQPDSGGAQFFVCVTEQPALTGQFTVFGRVSEGLDVVQKISEAAADAKGAPVERVTITAVTIRETPRPSPSRSRTRRRSSSRCTAPSSRPRSVHSRSPSTPGRPPNTRATSCSSRRRASSTARPSIAWCAGSSRRPGR